MAERERIDWEAVPIVPVNRAACPHCHCPSYVRLRTYANGDGSATKRMICSQCSRPYLAVEDLPEMGNVIWPRE